MTRFDEQLKAAVRASAASVPEDFLWNTEQMIDRLPRKERIIVRNKLSFGLVLAIILCMLTLTAVAAVLLTGQELVETEVLPMALENDTSTINETFTNEELAHIVTLAEENGITLSSSILRALEMGEGYWEEEVIMSLAKSQFGPIPGQWTLEEQYWFEETVVAIGFKDYNQCRIPAENDLPYEEAYAKAKAHIASQGNDISALDDRSQYDLWRSYKAVHDDDGSIMEPHWYFWFEPNAVNLPEFILTMDKAGDLTSMQYTPGLEELFALQVVPSYQVRDMFEKAYGSMSGWTPEVFIAYVDALRQSDLGVANRDAKAFLATEYILPPENAMSTDKAIELALAAVNKSGLTSAGTYCFLVNDRAIWKVTLRPSGGRVNWMVELDAITGEVLELYHTQSQGTAGQFYVPKSVWESLPIHTPNPEGLG